MDAELQVATAQPKELAVKLFDRQDFTRALIHLEAGLLRNPSDRELFNYKARALEALGRLDESLSCVEQSLRLNPQDHTDLLNRAALLTKLSRQPEAIQTLDRALHLQPADIDTLIKKAILLHQSGRREEALCAIERAISSAPAHLGALNTRGMILDDLGQRDAAYADYAKALSVDPTFSDAITNMAIIHARRGEYQRALECNERSLALNPRQANAIYNRGVIRLLLGNWPEGFADFESRWQLFPHEAARLTRLAPAWLGREDLTGKTILLHHEQGYGDTLQFCRYAPLVAARGGRVILAVPASLAKLVRTLPGSPRIVSEGEPVPAHDYHCPLMSLPLAFGTTPATAPAPIPYLFPDPGAVKRWGELLGERRLPRIGLVWSGRRIPPINHARDMTLDAVRPLLRINADFVCLQNELSDVERAQIRSLPKFKRCGERLVDFAHTAALVANLDLVITVDSAVAHLAGALGKPVWLMNRFTSCWRWLLGRSHTPWYPSMRLFRQPSIGDWTGVVQAILQASVSFIGPLDCRIEEHAELAGKTSTAPTPNLPELLQKALDQHNGGYFDDAVTSYQGILCHFPDQCETLHYLGVALAQLRRFDEALEVLERAQNMQPNNAAILNHYGNALAGASRYDEALSVYERAIVCDGGQAEIHFNRGVALMAMGQGEAALTCYTRANTLNPGYAQAFNNRGIVLLEMGRELEALTDYERAIAAQPAFADAWANRADLLRRLRRFDEALESSDKALGINPRHAEAHNGLGATLADLGRYEAAVASYDRAIEINPSSAEAIWNRGLVDLSCGRFLEGWRRYESRWGVKSLKLVQRFRDIPAWSGGQSLDGRTILLHAEQGYGDAIQFSRFCTSIAARGAHVILSAPNALHSLLKSLEGVQEVIGSTDTREFDFHCPLMSIPLALGLTVTDIPGPGRYLRGLPTAIERWSDRLKRASGALAVGLAWSGRSTHSKDLERTLRFDEVKGLIHRPIRWISLQKEVRPTDEPSLKQTPAIQRLGEELEDFADTAALIESLDLVITVDTAVAHLAGALGKPVWILLPFVADWRWLQGRDDTPWYPSARLFRQSTAGDWDSVLDRVDQELAILDKSHRPSFVRGRARPARSRPRARQK